MTRERLHARSLVFRSIKWKATAHAHRRLPHAVKVRSWLLVFFIFQLLRLRFLRRVDPFRIDVDRFREVVNARFPTHVADSAFERPDLAFMIQGAFHRAVVVTEQALESLSHISTIYLLSL